jgi:hypothetical protein
MQPKDYLTTERVRNTHPENAALYTKLIKRAFGDNIDVIVGHHIGFQVHEHIETENEIPSADTLLFDHDIMFAAFGVDRALRLMSAMIRVPCDQREVMVANALDGLEIDIQAA